MSDLAPTFRVGNFDIATTMMDDRDPRGLIWMWEAPQPNATYIVGVDPTVGITGWDRSLRSRDDHLTDNGAIQVVRCGNPDVQVAEYAAPVDAIELAPVVNFLGRLYSGSQEDGQAHVIIEVYPGPGWLTQRELINTFGYTNLYVWRYEDTFVPKRTSKYGWYSTRSSRRDLWMKGIHHITRGHCRVRSPWLIEEMTDCTPDNFLSVTARARGRRHDDRVVAYLLAEWAANEWSMAIEPTEAGGKEEMQAPDWQKSDMSANACIDAWEERFSALLESGGE